MPDLRPEEKVAAATIARTLGLEVRQHDDGKKSGVHDLSIVTATGLLAAVEVTAAADPDSIQLWKLVNGRDERWIVPGLAGGWMLTLQPTTRVRRLLKDLPALLRQLEDQGITDVAGQPGRPGVLDNFEKRARELGIIRGHQSGTDFPGSIYFTIEQPHERTGGIIDETGSAVPGWVREFLLHPHQSDILAKLARSGASERHAFILIPGFTSAPFGVVDMLWRPADDVVPTTPPQLPDQVTHVWLMTFWNMGSGLRWSSRGGWERFEREFSVDPQGK